MMLFVVPTDELPVLLGLLIMLIAAKLMAEVFERLRQPGVVGEILAGVIIGRGVLGWVSPSELTSSWPRSASFSCSLPLAWRQNRRPSFASGRLRPWLPFSVWRRHCSEVGC